MSDRAHTKAQTQQKTLSGSSAKGSLLQRTCACGQHTIVGAECLACRRNEQSTLLRSHRAFEPPSVLVTAQSNSPTQENVLSLSTAFDRASRFGHDFSRIPVHTSCSPVLQTKLVVNKLGDQYEQEAEHISEQVMRRPEPQLQHAYVCGGSCPKCQTERPGHGHERLQTKRVQVSDAGQIAAPSIVHDVLRSPGQLLDPAILVFMEPRFGHDFSHVRVHADARAADSAQALDALAYTMGQDMVFDAGQYKMDSNVGRKLIAHELTHVVQQGFATQAIQRQPNKKPKDATTNAKLVYDEIKKRNPDLAELITPGSIDFHSPKEPPAIKGGPMKSGEEHLWKVRVLAMQGFRGSQIVKGEEKRAKVKGGIQVTHFFELTWALPFATDKEFLKQTSSADEAFTLTAAEPLYHELLHARIMMEGDPNWTSQHTQVFQDFTNLMQIANSPAVDKERKALKQETGQMASGGGQAKNITLAQDNYYEFLVHEKYDADTESKAFGKSYPNTLIARRYSDVVAIRFGLGSDRTFQVLKDKLAAAAEKLFDKLGQAAKTRTPSTPTSSPPAAKQPKK